MSTELWLLRTEEARAQRLSAAWWPLLEAAEHARAARLRRPRDRERFVLSHGLLRQALSSRARVSPATWRLSYDQHGRPHIAEPTGDGLSFSISRCPGLVAVLVADRPGCGLDVERVSRVRDPLTTARGFFSPAEQAALETATPQRRDRLFAEHWALKEAWAKAVGRGLDLPVQRVDFAVASDGAVTMTLPPELGKAEAWQLELLEPTSEHVLAVARTAQPQTPLALRWWR